MNYYIGIDIGGTKCAVSIGNRESGVVAKRKFPTVSPSETIRRILEEAEALMLSAEGPVLAAGISCGGPLDAERGIIQSPPNLPGWDNIGIVRLVSERLGIPACLENDANACALAEWRFGAGAGSRYMVFLTFGTGMGAGIILDGKIYRGANGNAGEIGHVRMSDYGPIGYGKQGSFEGFASGGGIAMMAKSRAIERFQCGKAVGYCHSAEELKNISAQTVAAAANAGDEDALSVYRTCGEMLGRGLAILVDILNPEMIVIGSIYQRSEALLRDAMLQILKKECLPASFDAVRIVPARLGENLGDLAALSLAMSLKPEEQKK